MEPSKVVVLGLLVYAASHASFGVVAQSKTSYNCSKYCNKNCQDYFNGPEFSPCVAANVNCSCTFSMGSPLLVFLLVAGCMLSCFLVVLCCKKFWRERHQPGLRNLACNQFRSSSSDPVAVPVISTTINSSSLETTNLVNNQATNVTRYTNPMVSYPANNARMEYSPPPSYNQATAINVQEI